MTVVKEEGVGDGFGHFPIKSLASEPGIVSSSDFVNKFEAQTKERIIFPESPLYKGNEQNLVYVGDHHVGETQTILIPPAVIKNPAMTYTKTRYYLHVTQRSKRNRGILA